MQSYYDQFRAVLSSAVQHLVVGADAVWFFKQGLSERVRTAIAVYGDDSLDNVVLHDKRVDAAFSAANPHTTAVASSFIRGNANAGSTKRSGHTTVVGCDNKRSKASESATWDADVAKLRISKSQCSKYGAPTSGHNGPFGKHCPTSARKPPADSERAAIKGKGRA